MKNIIVDEKSEDSIKSSKRVVEATSASENFRHKRDNKAVVTTILRRPDVVPSDEPSKLRDETDELSVIKVDGGIAAALDSYYQPYGAQIYNNLNSIVRAARS